MGFHASAIKDSFIVWGKKIGGAAEGELSALHHGKEHACVCGVAVVVFWVL